MMLLYLKQRITQVTNEDMVSMRSCAVKRSVEPISNRNERAVNKAGLTAWMTGTRVRWRLVKWAVRK